MEKSWTRVDVSCVPEAADELGAELADKFGSSVEQIDGGVRIYFDASAFAGIRDDLQQAIDRFSGANPDHGQITWSLSEIADEDWSETWKAHFKPLRVGGRFVVAPTWEQVNPGPNDRVIRIDPGRAFGTGHHETTRLCLEWLEQWVDARTEARFPASLLDIGTGSGILAIAGGLLGFENITGIDNDPEAIEVAVPNIELNGLAGKIRVLCASPEEIDSRFDVVISNIQSLPLIRMAGTLISRVKEGGRLALSGILDEQADQVCSEYLAAGATPVDKRAAGEWVLLEFRIGQP